MPFEEICVLASIYLAPFALGGLLYLLARRWPQGGRKREFLSLVAVNLLVFLLACSVILAIGEIYYRHYADSTDSFGLNRMTPRWLQRHYQYNNAGLRDNVDYTYLPEGRFRRLTFFGDSFTAGHGIKNVEDRFANIIRRKLGQNWEVHAIAKNGVDTAGELNMYKLATSRGYHLQEVILVYVLNDIADADPQWQQVHRRIYQKYRSDNPYVQLSYFVNTWYYRLAGAGDPDIANYYSFVQTAYEDPLIWAVQQARLRFFREEVTRQGGHLKVVIFPFLHVMGPAYPYHFVHEKVRELWEKENVPYLDLYEVYKNYAAKDLVLSRYDAHPNKFAHRLAAKAILSFIEETRELSESPENVSALDG